MKYTRKTLHGFSIFLIAGIMLGVAFHSFYIDNQNQTDDFVKMDKPTSLFQDIDSGFFVIGYDKNAYNLVESNSYYFITKTELIK